MNFVREYTLFFGPFSSLYDFLTYGIMLFIFNASPARAVSRPDLGYFKPDYAEDTGPETYHQVDGLEDAQAEEVSEKWDIEHKTERKKGAAEDPP